MAENLFPDEPDLRYLKTLPDHKNAWVLAARLAEPEVTPFSAKALYIIGVIRHSIEASGWLLKHRRITGKWRGAFYVSAYLQTAAAVELLGRCVLGDSEIVYGSGKRLCHGFKEIARLPDADRNNVVLTAGRTAYTIGQCETLRNFAAHGAGVAHDNVSFDGDLICGVTKLLAQGAERYWSSLGVPTARAVRAALADAAVAPVFYCPAGMTWPIHISEMLKHVKSGASVGSGLLHSETWSRQKT